MKGNSPFRRAKDMFAAIGAALKAFRGDLVALRGALDAIGPYESKRKSGSRPHTRRTTRPDQRAALKKRNRRRNRLAHRRHSK